MYYFFVFWMYYCLSNEQFLYKSATQNSKSVRTQISIPDLYSILQPNSANNLNDTTNNHHDLSVFPKINSNRASHCNCMYTMQIAEI